MSVAQYLRFREIGHVVNHIATRWYLTGQGAQDSAQLQDYLFRTAKLLIREDRDYLQRTCRHLENHMPGFRCRLQGTEQDANKMPVSPRLSPGSVDMD